MDRREREVRKIARRYGLEVSTTRGSHLALRSRDGALIAVTSWSSSDWRALRNLEAQLRKAAS